MSDAVERYCAAAAAADIDGVIATLAPDVAIVSPLSARFVFRGTRDARVLLGAVYRSLSAFRWIETVRDGDRVVVVGEGRIFGCRLGDAMVFDLDREGRIARIRPHLRPWLGLTAFALRLAPAMLPHPGVIRRALRG